MLGLTDPPYWIRIASAASCPCSRATTERIYPIVSFACSFVAVNPVPIAQIGSYAITVSLTCSKDNPAKARLICASTTWLVVPFSRSSNDSPQHTIGINPLANAAWVFFFTF